MSQSEIKQLLKEAKTELSNGYYEDAIDVALKVLKLDEENYFALIFLGKSYASLSDNADVKSPEEVYKNALKYYTKATTIQPTNLLAWKGLFQLFLSPDKLPQLLPQLISFEDFFHLLDEYMNCLLANEQSQVEMIDLLRTVKSQNKDDINFLLKFYKHYIPGEKPYETLGRHLMTPLEALLQLLKLAKINEEKLVSSKISNERMKLSSNDPLYQQKINLAAWNIYKDSLLSNYYNQLINLIDDDLERQKWEQEWFEYKIKILKSIPDNEQKQVYFNELKDIVDDMVLVGTNSLLCWKYYFDWSDFSDINSIDPQLILNFFTKFPKEPLASILYVWLNSSYSDYDSKRLITEFNEKLSKELKTDVSTIVDEEKRTDEDTDELDDMLETDDTNNNDQTLSEEDISITLMDNISKVKNSTLAYRVVSQYYILNKEYDVALPFIKSGISVVSLNMRDYGADLSNTKNDLTLALATGYTYVEAPKNHKYAISLYEKILRENEQNIHAKLGKAIISIERDNWQDAHLLLEDVIKEAPTNLEVMSQLAWTKAHLHEFDNSLKLLNSVISKIEGVDIRMILFRSENLWREAKVYLMKYNHQEDKDMELVKASFKILISIIKFNPDGFSKSYSTLGDIYSNYYQDKTRAYKCYYKSFELDFTDIVAARFLTEIYTENGNWNAASQIAERLVKGESVKTQLRYTNWPYRVIGIAYLEKKEESQSIEWFQSAIRVDSTDVESWVGLGQAYYASGRIDASIKVFEKAIELDPTHSYAHYFNAISQSSIGEYSISIDILRAIAEAEPENIAFKSTLATTLVQYAYDLYYQNYLQKSISIASESIGLFQHIISELKHTSQSIWVSLSKTLYLYILVESQIDLLPLESLLGIFQSLEYSSSEEIDTVDHVTLENILNNDSSDNIHITCMFLVLASKLALVSDDFESLSGTVRSSIWCNIGVSELINYVTLKEEKFRHASVYAFKKAIKYQSNTIEAWIGLGISTMDVNYRVAQHSFIKAISYAPKDVAVWFNLAMLGLKNNDLDFASDVMKRMQSLEPHSSSPWLGMALVLEKRGEASESSQMYAHAYSLSNGKSRLTQLLYAKSVLGNRIGQKDDERDIDAMEELTAIAAGLEQYFKKRPNDTFALECALMVLERLHNYKMANTLANKLTTIFEKRFDESQDEKELFNYGIIKAQLARIQLGYGQYTESIENSDLSNGILVDFDSEKGQYARLSNHICLGLSNFFLGNFDETINHFQELLNDGKSIASFVIMIAKVLFEVSTDDTRTIAIQELMQYIEDNGFDLMVSLTIAVIAILEDDSECMKAMLTKLTNLSLRDLESDRHKEVPKLIKQICDRINPKKSHNINKQRTAFLFPNNNNSWNGVDKKIEQRLMTNGQNKVSAEDLSNAYCKIGNLSNIQRSLFLCPWNKSAVTSLKECF